MDHLGPPWDAGAQIMMIPGGRGPHGFFPANSLKLSYTRLKIEAKEEQWGQTSVKGKTVDKITLAEVSQREKRKKVHEPGKPHIETV